MVKLDGKVSASTLLEVIVAMVVILIVFVLSTGIYTNVMRSSPSLRQQRIKSLAAGLIQQSIAECNWNDDVVAIDSLHFQKTLSPYQGYTDLKLLQVVVVEQGKEVWTARSVVKMREDDAK